MGHSIISPKKLIEVALPLDAINMASAREKSIRHGHPSTLHLWWARRPLAAARAVIFSQLVNDPEDLWRCQNPGKDANSQVKGHWTKTRARLFSIIEHFVKWENIADDSMLEKAREEIRKSWRDTCDLNKNHPNANELFNPDKMPGLHDPFSGGGTIPLEAQRLGLEAFASDLNPVAVLINKAMIEIPPKFVNRPPVHPDARKEKMLIARDWKGAQGISEDVIRYGNWIREEALKRIGRLYPYIEITKDMVRERADLKPYLGEKLTVIAWLWTRTVRSPNPAFSTVHVPLASSFVLSSKAGKEAYVDTIIDKSNYRFTVKIGKAPSTAKSGTKSARGANFRCLLSQAAIEPNYIKAESVTGRMGAKLMAIVAEGANGRIWLSPNAEHEAIAKSAMPEDAANAIHVPLANDPRNLWCLGYGLDHFDKLFTPRQLVALTTFSDLVKEVRAKIAEDAVAAGFVNDDVALENGGAGAAAYADGIAVYLGLGIGRSANYWSSLTPWGGDFIVQTFGRQAIPMVWDYAEGNVFSSSTGNWTGALDWIQRVIVNAVPAYRSGVAVQADAQSQAITSNNFVSTDPPYYDNIAYADLSDYFYVWLRRSLRPVLPKLFGTISVPKAEELVATPYRHGSKEKAESFFLNGMTEAMHRLAEQAHPGYPVTIYYAFKQSESETDTGTASTGWETFLEAVIRAGFSVVGTWPMRTERDQGLKTGTNVLASSIVLVCRRRGEISETISRRQFVRELNAALPIALDAMTRESEGLHSPVAPVDLSQAIIGPGMAVYSKYTAILEADGTPMNVRTAMQLINRFLAEDDFDADTQFCLHWFEQYGWESGKFGEADTLARAKGTSVEGVKQSGVIRSAGGNVQLLKWAAYPSDWDPRSDQRLPIWEVLHRLIRVFNTEGEAGAAKVFAAVQSKAEAARQLAYRLYTLCERKNWAEDARAYNEVVTSWSGIESAATKEPAPVQQTLFE
jgi:putative DNA methylase